MPTLAVRPEPTRQRQAERNLRSGLGLGTVLLALAMLPGCGSPCGGAAERCLMLRVEGSGVYSSVAVTLRYDAPVFWGQQAPRQVLGGPIALPATLPVALPSDALPAAMRNVTVTARSADGTTETSGSAVLELSDAASLAATVSQLFSFERRDVALNVSAPMPLPHTLLAGANNDVALGDLNSDGQLDLAVVHTENQFSFRLGAVDGGYPSVPLSAPFIMPQNVAGGSVSYPRRVAILDVDNDGRNDVVASGLYLADLSVHLGAGDGSLKPEQHLTAFSDGTMASLGISIGTFIVADLDGKAPLDFVVVENNNGTRIVLVKNLSTPGVLKSAPVVVDLGVTPDQLMRNGIGTPALADLDGDGFPDLLAPHQRSSYSDVDIIWGNAAGTWGTPNLSLPAGDEPNSVVVADMNSDRCSDFATVSDQSTTLHVFLQNCSGGVGQRSFREQIFRFGLPHYGPMGLRLGDLDGDGMRDLFMLDSHGGEVLMMLGRGDGTFAPPLAFSAGSEPVALALADIDRDGALDVAVANQWSPFATFLYLRR